MSLEICFRHEHYVYWRTRQPIRHSGDATPARSGMAHPRMTTKTHEDRCGGDARRSSWPFGDASHAPCRAKVECNPFSTPSTSMSSDSASEIARRRYRVEHIWISDPSLMMRHAEMPHSGRPLLGGEWRKIVIITIRRTTARPRVVGRSGTTRGGQEEPVEVLPGISSESRNVRWSQPLRDSDQRIRPRAKGAIGPSTAPFDFPRPRRIGYETCVMPGHGGIAARGA
jgi:hypothetical protein